MDAAPSNWHCSRFKEQKAFLDSGEFGARIPGEGKIIILTPSGNIESAKIFPGDVGERLVAFVSSAAFRRFPWGGGGHSSCVSGLGRAFSGIQDEEGYVGDGDAAIEQA